jgi:hypothetical protein
MSGGSGDDHSDTGEDEEVVCWWYSPTACIASCIDKKFPRLTYN